jgi:hypothetical protein
VALGRRNTLRPTLILSERLINEGYLLAEDLELVVDQESRRYGLLAVAREPVAAGE